MAGCVQLFFDNEVWNCRDVEKLGVTCIHTPRGALFCCPRLQDCLLSAQLCITAISHMYRMIWYMHGVEESCCGYFSVSSLYCRQELLPYCTLFGFTGEMSPWNSLHGLQA